MNKLYDLLLQARMKAENEEGQGVIEYVLVAGVISLALFVAFQTTGIAGQITSTVGEIVDTMAGS
jgi:Flp pilus assembly pilin Flp